MNEQYINGVDALYCIGGVFSMLFLVPVYLPSPIIYGNPLVRKNPCTLSEVCMAGLNTLGFDKKLLCIVFSFF